MDYNIKDKNINIKIIVVLSLLFIIISALALYYIPDNTNEEVEIVSTSSDVANNDSITEIDKDYKEKYISINGTIIGNNSGQKIIIEDYYYDSSRIYINIGLEQKNDIFNPVMTEYKYNIRVNNKSVQEVIVY